MLYIKNVAYVADKNNSIWCKGIMFIRFSSIIGLYAITITNTLGKVFFFVSGAVACKNTTKFGIKQWIYSMYTVGVSSVIFISFIAFFTGLILGLQGYYTLTRFGAEALLGNAVAITLVQELAPVLTAIMVVARVGSATTSHLAVMRSTEQINALYVNNINPLHYLVRPAILAFSFSMPILTLFFISIALFSAYIIGVVLLYLPAGTYIHGIISSTPFSNIMYSMIKACTFGFIISAISCYIGYNIHTITQDKGATAVRYATTKSVVLCCIIILIANYILTSILFT